jgi:hypothetical protein
VAAPSKENPREGGAHRGQGRRHGGGYDVSSGVGELRWRATVVTRTYSTGEPRGSEMRQKNGGKIGERWSSLKGGNGGGVAAESGGVGGASMSRRGWEVEGVKGKVLSAPIE